MIPIDPSCPQAVSSNHAGKQDRKLQILPQPGAAPARGLDDLFDVSHACVCLLRTDDQTLSPDSPPPILRGVTEGSLIWSTILAPSKDRGQISGRQAVVEDLMDSDLVSRAKELKDAAYDMAAGHKTLFTRVFRSEYDDEGIPALLLVRQAGENSGNTRATDLVAAGLEQIARGRDAIKALAALLDSSCSEPLKALASDLCNLYQETAYLNRNYFLGTEFDESRSEETVAKASGITARTGALVEVARICREDRLAKISFNPVQPVAYEGGYSHLCPESKNHRNPSPGDNVNTVLAGGNMSGKTEGGLKVRLFAQLWAQAFGYAPVASGNFRIHDFFFYLDRPCSDSRRRLSSFGVEIINLKELCKHLEQSRSPFGVFDEFGSTTSPEDQLRFLFGVATFLAESRCRTTFATHNERFIGLAARLPDYGVYHFDIKILPDGRVIYTYQLAPGPADSNSILVAESLKFDARMVSRAKDYHRGDLVPAVVPAQLPFRPVQRYADEERQALKQKARTGNEILFRRDSRLFWPFSYDKEMRAGEDPWFSEMIPISGDESRWERKPAYVLGRQIVFGGDTHLLTRMIFEAPVLSSQELLERQLMFKQLAANDRYDDLKRLHADVELAVRAIDVVRGAPSLLLEFNRNLNPFNQGIHVEQREQLDLAVAFLGLNRKILGDKFNLQREYEFAKNVQRLYLEVSEWLDNLPLERLAEILEGQRNRPLSGEGRELYLRIAAALGEKADGPLTLAQASSLLATVNSLPYDKQESLNQDCSRLRECLSGELTPGFDLEAQKAKLAPFSASFEGRVLCRRTLREVLSSAWSEKLRDSVQECLFEVYQALDLLPLQGEPFQQRASALLSDPLASGNGSTYPCLYALSICANKLASELGYGLGRRIPAVSAFSVDLEAVREELAVITPFFRGRMQSDRHRDLARYSASDLTAILMDVWLERRNVLAEFISILRGYDSVHLHQLSNSIAQGVAGFGFPNLIDTRPDRGASIASQISRQPTLSLLLSPERISELSSGSEEQIARRWAETEEDLRIDDPRKAFQRLSLAYQRQFEHLDRAVMDLDAEWNARQLEFGFRDNQSWMLNAATKMASGQPLDRKEVETLCRAYIRREGPGDSIPLERDLSSVDIYSFFHTRVKASAFGRSILEWHRWESEFEARVKLFVDANKLSLEESEGHDPILTLRRAMRRRFGELGRTVLSWCDRDADDISRDLTAACSLALFGRHIRLENYAAVNFNDNGDVLVTGMRNLFDTWRSVPQSFEMSTGNRTRILSGPQMSGKTYHEKSSTLLMASGLATGFAPCTSASIPLFDGVVFADRITGKDDLKLSAAGQEFRNWQNMLRVIRGGGIYWIAADEAFSTLSPRYQEAFTYSAETEFIEGGHYSTTSLHNHGAIDSIARLNPCISVSHFSYHIDAGGVIHFERVLTPGHAMSEAIPVARAFGIDSKILRAAESVAVT